MASPLTENPSSRGPVSLRIGDAFDSSPSRRRWAAFRLAADPDNLSDCLPLGPLALRAPISGQSDFGCLPFSGG
jgi:hypothetical protein